jgi:twinkle protein
MKDYGVFVTQDKKYGTVQVYPYFDTHRKMVAQHLRTKKKEFPWIGQPSEAAPFGYNVRNTSGQRLILVEGEIDALSAYQMFNRSWPVWSIGSGAGPQVRSYIGKRRDLFRNFEEVVIAFDNDDAGEAAAEIAAEVIGHDIAKIAKLPLKDANEMLKAGEVGAFKGAIYSAKRWTPDEILTLEDLDLDKEPVRGISTGYQSFDDLTLGLRPGEIHVIGAGTSAGKTDFMLQIVAHLLRNNINVATFFLEQSPVETGIRLAGKFGKLPLHIPANEGGWTTEQRAAAIQELKATPGKVYLYDSFGINEWKILMDRIRPRS